VEHDNNLYWRDRAACTSYWEAVALDRTVDAKNRLLARMETVRVLLETHLQDALVHAAFLLAETAANTEGETIPADWAYNRGVLALQRHEFAQAFEYLGRAAIDGGDTAVRARTDEALGRYYAAKGKLERAVACVEGAIARWQAAAQPQEEGRAGCLLAKILGLCGAWTRSREICDQSLELAIAHDSPTLRLQALVGLVNSYVALEDGDMAAAFAFEALDAAVEPFDRYEIAQLQTALLRVALQQEDWSAAEQLLQEGVMPHLALLTENNVLQAHIAASRGRLVYQKVLAGQESLTPQTLEQAEDFLVDATVLCESQGMVYEYARTLYDLAQVYRLGMDTGDRYQYQGKRVRSLRLGLDALDNFHNEPAERLKDLLNEALEQALTHHN
jgi:tetratricopeptide (TPR) repeat protein